MSNEKDFQQRVQRIGALVQEIDTIADPAVTGIDHPAGAIDHGVSWHRAWIGRWRSWPMRGGPGMEIIEQLGRDPMVSSLLVLYGLHPDSLETRVDQGGRAAQAEDAQGRSVGGAGGHRRMVRSAYGSLPAIMLADRPARLCRLRWRMRFTKLRRIIASLSVEGLEGKPASGFVSLGKLTAAAPVSSKVTALRAPSPWQPTMGTKDSPTLEECIRSVAAVCAPAARGGALRTVQPEIASQHPHLIEPMARKAGLFLRCLRLAVQRTRRQPLQARTTAGADAGEFPDVRCPVGRPDDSRSTWPSSFTAAR